MSATIPTTEISGAEIPNAAIALSLADALVDLGGIPPDRLRVANDVADNGVAGLKQLTQAHAAGIPCELIDGRLVEKVTGYRESLLAAVLIELLGAFVRPRKLGLVSGADGFIQLFPSVVQGPDVAFISWDRLPGRQLPEDAYPAIVPELVVEIISQGNTRAEMARKRREYFQAGVTLVWMVDPLRHSVAVFTSATQYEVLFEHQSVSGGDVLPDLTISLPAVFAVLDQPPTE